MFEPHEDVTLEHFKVANTPPTCTGFGEARRSPSAAGTLSSAGESRSPGLGKLIAGAAERLSGAGGDLVARLRPNGGGSQRTPWPPRATLRHHRGADWLGVQDPLTSRDIAGSRRRMGAPGGARGPSTGARSASHKSDRTVAASCGMNWDEFIFNIDVAYV